MKVTVRPARVLALTAGSLLGMAASNGWAAESLGRSYLEAQQDEVEVFIRLETPSVSELNAASLRATGAFASRAEQQRQAARVDAEQAAFRPMLGSFNARELSSQRVGANGLRVSVPVGHIETLKSLPGVRSVGRVEQHTISHFESVPWVGAIDAANEFGLTGEGITIGIIDTGIDYTHANFGGPGTVAAYTGNDPNVLEPDTFPTAKVVGGFDFAGPTYNAQIPDSVPQPDADPLDVGGHGSHVAGSAGGFGVSGSIGPGVAPNALLYALKVFGDEGGSTGVTSLAIEWAMDPNGDGDMSDHLDVINMSLGSNWGEAADPSAISSENAAALGIIVVAASGNAGDVPYITSSPAIAPSAISVAATVPGGRDFATLTIDAPAALAGPKFNEEGTSPARVSSIAPHTNTVVKADPLLACDPLTNGAAIAGKIALIQRGVCTFQIKSANALAAGATAVLMVNSLPGDPITMGGITAAIPGVMISLADGTPVIAAATTDASSPVVATFGFGPDPTKEDRIAGFSSSGPGHGGTTFKPDISAPGVSIRSTAVGTGTGSALSNGTSMATPHVAGAAALLREQRPDLDQSGIKALLLNSSVNGNPSGDDALSRHGVGTLRVDAAAGLTSYASPAGVSFGRVNVDKRLNRTEHVQLVNLGDEVRDYSVTHVAHSTYPGVTVTCPKHVKVGRRAAREFPIRLRFDAKAAPAAGVFDNASVSQREVGGWCVLDDGEDTLRVGYLAAVDSASRMKADKRPHGLRIRNDGPAVGFAEGFTLAGTGGDGASGTYGSIAHLGVRSNAFGAFPVVEFGISLDEAYEHVSNLDVDLFLDTDGDGADDVRLVARDWTAFQPVPPAVIGTYVTAQFVVGGAGFLDWIASGWDFSDRVLILPFTREAGGGLVTDSFNYRLVVSDRQGNTDVQTGTIDLADEVVPDLNSFGLADREAADVGVSRRGTMLWLFPNNEVAEQENTAAVKP